MAKVTIMLHTSRPTPTAEKAIVLRIASFKERKYFYLGLHCQPEEWNDAAGRLHDSKTAKIMNASKSGSGLVYRKHEQALRDNMIITAKLQEAEAIIASIEISGKPFSFDQFTIEFKKTNKVISAKAYFQSIIKDLESSGKIGNAHAYENACNAIERFSPGVKLEHINVFFLTRFEQWLRKRSVMDTTISVYMRTTRAMINKATAAGLFSVESYPFSRNASDRGKYHISNLNIKTEKRSLNAETIEKIKAMSFEAGGKLELCHQLFLFSYYARGMNFSDISLLKSQDLKNGRIKYIRKKTGQKFDLPITEQLATIIERLKQKESDYVFPILNDAIYKTEKQKHTRIKTVIKIVNKGLKEIAAIADVPGLKLTTYVARHTYATTLKRAGVPVHTISELMGHDNQETTAIYLDEISPERLDQVEAGLL